MAFIRCIIATLTWSLMATHSAAQSPAQKADALEKALRTVEESARNDRHVTGAGLLMLGAASGVGAAFSNQSANPDLKRDGPLLFGVMGGTFALSGFLMLAMSRDYETFPQKFRKLPRRNSAELAKKVKTGEQMLTRLAERSEWERMWFGSAATGVGLGAMTWYMLDSQYLGGAMLYFGGFALFVGVVSFVTDSPAEAELAKYREADNEIELGWNMAPIDGGMAMQVSLRF